MQSQFMAAINQLCDEKNLPKEIVIDTVKAALRAAYRKDYGNREQNVDVDLDDKSGNITVYLLKEVQVLLAVVAVQYVFLSYKRCRPGQCSP